MEKSNREKIRSQRYKAQKCRNLALVLACLLLIGGIVGGTLAWLTDKTDSVTNTFHSSTIGVTLEENEKVFKMIPGWAIDKNPVAAVTAESEDCYLFVKVEGNGVSFTPEGETMPVCYAVEDYLWYEIAEGWSSLPGHPGVYYRVIDDATEKGQSYKILGAGNKVFEEVTYSWADGQVMTRPDVTKEMMDVINENNRPTLTFTAYAVQLWKTNKPAEGASADQIKMAQFTLEDAWTQVSN